MKNIVILGSTGSIGVSSLDIIKEFNSEYNVVALTAQSNIELLEKQINIFHPERVVVTNIEKAKELREKIGNTCEVLEGEESLISLTQTNNYDILISSLVGFAGLAPTIESIKLGKRIALANKETMVVAGEIINSLVEKYNAEILPVDSEHSAIYQCLIGERFEDIKKIILTASGGPFFSKTFDEIKNVSVKEALNHPNWSMGNKITIDSATMMNKGLEVIEAKWLFNIPTEKIDVIVHPQSIIHSMVEFNCGSIKAQLSTPDMKLPILYALSFPKRLPYNNVVTNFLEVGTLTFKKPDLETFRCLKLAYNVLEQGGTASCILNAANEIAVNKFLNNRISFVQIPEIIEESLNKIENHQSPTLETIFDCDRRTREFANNYIN